MEKHTASRKLRKNYRENISTTEEEKETSSLAFRLFLGGILIIVLYLVHENCPEIVHKNKYLSMINQEYKKNYTISDIKKSVEAIAVKYKKINNIQVYKENKSKTIEHKETIPVVKSATEEALPVQPEPKPQPQPQEEVPKAIEVSSISNSSIIKAKINKEIKFKIPVNGQITSRYGVRVASNYIVTPYHTGIDIANKLKTPIKSATDGVVVGSHYNKYYGNVVDIKTENVVCRYAHLSKSNVKLNQEIKQGDIIGLMGSTGNSTGPHLHFEIKVENKNINPEEIIDELSKDKI